MSIVFLWIYSFVIYSSVCLGLFMNFSCCLLLKNICPNFAFKSLNWQVSNSCSHSGWHLFALSEMNWKHFWRFDGNLFPTQVAEKTRFCFDAFDYGMFAALWYWKLQLGFWVDWSIISIVGHVFLAQINKKSSLLHFGISLITFSWHIPTMTIARHSVDGKFL